MNTLRTRIARLSVASALALGLGALAASPAVADPSIGRGGPASVTLAADDDTSTDSTGKSGDHVTLATADDDSTDGGGRPGGSVEDVAIAGPVMMICAPSLTRCVG